MPLTFGQPETPEYLAFEFEGNEVYYVLRPKALIAALEESMNDMISGKAMFLGFSDISPDLAVAAFGVSQAADDYIICIYFTAECVYATAKQGDLPDFRAPDVLIACAIS